MLRPRLSIMRNPCNAPVALLRFQTQHLGFLHCLLHRLPFRTAHYQDFLILNLLMLPTLFLLWMGLLFSLFYLPFSRGRSQFRLHNSHSLLLIRPLV